jgi:hypothetical protein
MQEYFVVHAQQVLLQRVPLTKFVMLARAVNSKPPAQRKTMILMETTMAAFAAKIVRRESTKSKQARVLVSLVEKASIHQKLRAQLTRAQIVSPACMLMTKEVDSAAVVHVDGNLHLEHNCVLYATAENSQPLMAAARALHVLLERELKVLVRHHAKLVQLEKKQIKGRDWVEEPVFPVQLENMKTLPSVQCAR